MSNFIFDKENSDFLENLELLSKGKDLKKDVINKAVETAMETALTEYFKNLYDVIVKIKSNGAISAYKKLKIVSHVTDIYKEIAKEEVKELDASLVHNDEVHMPISITQFSASTIKKIKYLIYGAILQAEKEAEFNYFKKLKGFIINGVVKKIYNQGGFLIGIDKYEAFLPRSQAIATEDITQGDKIEAIIGDVERNDVKPQALLSRTSEEFLFELLKQAIPEIADGVIEIKAIARDAGSRSKVAVLSKDPTVNAAVLCVVTYGRKIRAISKSLARERIEIINWDEDPAVFLMNALKSTMPEISSKFEKEQTKKIKPINILNITIDYEDKSLDVIIDEADISFAIGRKGQNVRLLSKLIGWPIHFVTTEEDSQNKFDEVISKAESLAKQLDLSEGVAQMLVIEDMDTIEKIVEAPISKLTSLEGFDTEIASEIKERAKVFFLEKQEKELKILEEHKKNSAKLAKDIGITEVVAFEFVKKGINNKSLLADLSNDEAIEDYKVELLPDVISNAIMKARGF